MSKIKVLLLFYVILLEEEKKFWNIRLFFGTDKMLWNQNVAIFVGSADNFGRRYEKKSYYGVFLISGESWSLVFECQA